jgi:PAS domain S-box-containing protein
MPPLWSESHYFFFSAAILATAVLGGLGPGLLATAASAVVSDYLFVAPFHNFQIAAPEAAERLAIFIIEGVIISSVGRVIRDNRTPELFSAWSRYAAAIVLVAGAGVLKVLFLPSLERHVPFTFFYSAVVATAWVGGAAPAMVATILATASIHLLFFRAPAEPALGNPGLMLFAFEAIALSLLTAIFRQRLVETEAHLGRVFEDSPTGILLLDRSARILKANPACQGILHADPVRLEGRLLVDLVDCESLERVRTFLDDLMKRRTVVAADEVCLACVPTRVWTNLRGSWIHDSTDTSPACMVMVEDITERKRTEDAMRESEVRLERAQRIEAIGIFAAGIAHDFNNLLSVIFGCCERQLFLNDLPPEARRYTEEILQTAKSAADLTRQLLAFARRRPPTDQVVSVNRVVTDYAALLQRLLGPRIELKTELAPAAGRVRADPSQLQQILMNLAANARDAMPSGGRLTITTGTPLPARPFVTLQVTDTGHGMDEATRAHIFEPLFSTKEPEKGAGLGLATVHSIVTKLGGHIAVETSPGNGACFSIDLPDADQGAEAGKAAGQSGVTRDALSKPLL